MRVKELFVEDKDNKKLKVFAEAQTLTIIELNKKINKLEEKNKHLESLLQTSVPLIKTEVIDTAEDEETIARTQLHLLKNQSMGRELTLEETRKVEIYAKLLIQLKEKNKNPKNPAEKLSTEELLKLVEKEDGQIN